MSEELELTVARGRRAQQILDDDIVVEAFAKIEADALHEWRGTKPDERDKREHAWRTLRVLDEFKTKLRVVMSAGEMAAAQIRRQPVKR